MPKVLRDLARQKSRVADLEEELSRLTVNYNGEKQRRKDVQRTADILQEGIDSLKQQQVKLGERNERQLDEATSKMEAAEAQERAMRSRAGRTVQVRVQLIGHARNNM